MAPRGRSGITLTGVDSPALTSADERLRRLESLADAALSRLDVPDLIGVLYAGPRQPRAFTADEVRLLELAAGRAGVAGQSRSQKLEHAAALALQRSLLPAKLPDLPGLQVAARYQPGHGLGVGGDWYDVFTLPSGGLGAVIGDVSGHGLASAVVMGRIRSALRAYALTGDDPAEVLTLLDRKIHHFEAGTLTTALYIMVSPDRETLRISCAGHLRPLLAAPGRPAELTDIPVDGPLGVGRTAAPRRTGTVAMPEQSLLLCYTDGLVERRDRIIDVGIKALTNAVHADHPEAACNAAMSLVTDQRPGDDIAVLALRRVPPAGTE